MAKKKVEENNDEAILKRARERFDRCVSWERDFRARYIEDTRFANGDPDNGWQWPDSMRKQREIDSRPCLTINKVRQHVLQIVNDAKQNKPGVVVHAVGNGATYEAAETFEGIIRHIEYISNAQQAYDTATEFQVTGGMGYWRLMTDYANDTSFDQEIFIRRIRDPLSVYLDPDIKEADGSDARFGFVYDDLPRDVFEAKYPNATSENLAPLGNGDDWLSKDHVRVAEYYEKTEESDELGATQMDDGSTQLVRRSDLPKDGQKVFDNDETVQKRNIKRKVIKWYLIAGNEILDRKEIVGSYVPIVRVLGEEVVIEGQLDRKGHVRLLKDPQRMYNYWTSSAVEFVALQGKQPYLAPVEAIEGFEDYWATANTINHSYLPYNSLSETGDTIPPPARQQPPSMAQGYIQGMQNAAEEMKMVSGQYDPTMGANPQDQSGVALQAQQRKGDRATYHYIDNLARAIRFTGKILIDWIPKVYDTQRVLRILGEDGTDQKVTLDPDSQDPQTMKRTAAGVETIFNPSVGQYDVESAIGPAYATQRQEAFAALSQIAAQNPEMMKIIGDLVFKAADFPMADELADRLRRMIPPQVLGEGPTPQEQQMQQQMQHMNQMIQVLTQDLQKERQKVEDKSSDIQVDSYKAETDRLKVLGGGMTPEAIGALVSQAIQNALATPMPPQQQPDNQQPVDNGMPQPQNPVQTAQQQGAQ
jgi:hypothetical protein